LVFAHLHSRADKKREYIAKELLHTEDQYVQSLETIIGVRVLQSFIFVFNRFFGGTTRILPSRGYKSWQHLLSTLFFPYVALT
jgi:hypothetical protein